MNLAMPDVISNSYYPAIAAIEFGFFCAEDLDVELELLFPVDQAYAALRDGKIEMVAGSARAALAAFSNWEGVKQLRAQAQGICWFLVVHKDLDARRGEIDVDKVAIAPVPGAVGAGENFGLTAAKAL